MEIEFTRHPLAQEIDFLTGKINEDFSEVGEAYPFGFFMRDDGGEIIAGCNGSVVYGSIYTDQLWVHPDHRRSGFARQLMEKVHGFGRAEHCSFSTVTTMDFQGAQAFYEGLGYQVDFERPGYANKSVALFLKKEL